MPDVLKMWNIIILARIKMNKPIDNIGEKVKGQKSFDFIRAGGLK